MFDFTRDYVDVLKRDFKRAELVFSIINIIATIAYPIFAIIVKLGNLYVNIGVLILAIIYGLLQFILGNEKKFKIDRIYAWSKIFLSTVALGINIYSIYIATTNVNGVAIILSTIMTIFWILKVILNLVYDILMPRLHTLTLCLIEDSKPYANAFDTVAYPFLKRKVFNLPKEVPDEVVKATKKAKEIEIARKENAINDEIKAEYKRIIDETDSNNDGVIDLPEIIYKGLTMPDIIVDKEAFIRQEFTSIFDKPKIDKYIKYGPTKVGLSETELIRYSSKLIAETKQYIDITRKYINDDQIIEYKDEKDFKKCFQAFCLTLMTMQKIIYLYGFKQIVGANELEDIQLTALVLALSISLDDEEAIPAKDELYTLHKNALKISLQKMANDKIDFIKNHQSGIRRAIVLGLPVATKILARYSKAGKVAVAAQAVMNGVKKIV